MSKLTKSSTITNAAGQTFVRIDVETYSDRITAVYCPLEMEVNDTWEESDLIKIDQDLPTQSFQPVNSFREYIIEAGDLDYDRDMGIALAIENADLIMSGKGVSHAA